MTYTPPPGWMRCPDCYGRGEFERLVNPADPYSTVWGWRECAWCGGSGEIRDPDYDDPWATDSTLKAIKRLDRIIKDVA